MAQTTDSTRRGTPWFTRTLVVLTLVSLMQDAASELLYPLLPIFLTGVLAAPPVVLGVIEGVSDATAGVVRYFAGKWSDAYGRKRFIGAGYGLAAVGKAIVASAASWPMVLVGRASDRFGKGLRSAPRDALLASSTSPSHLGRVFGFHRMGDSLGAVIGPLLGLVALSVVGDNIRAAMWWAVVPATLSVLLTGLIRESRTVPTTRPQPAVTVSNGRLPDAYRRVVTVLAVVALVNFSDALLLLRIVNLGFSTTEVIAAYVIFNAVYTVASYPAGVLSDRWSRRSVYSVGLGFFAIGYLGLGLVSGGPWVYVIVGVYGLFPALTDGVGKAWIASLVEPSQLGRAQGVYQGLNNGAILCAGLWAGLLWTAGEGKGTVPLIISGACAAVAAVFVAGHRRLDRKDGVESTRGAAAHWEHIYETKATTDVSWFENEPTTSLRLITTVSNPTDSVVDIGAGASFLVDRLFETGYNDVSVLDISTAALENVRDRFSGTPRSPTFVVADVTTWTPDRTFDVWHDRAVFHFMVTEQMREGYKRALSAAVRPGGHAVIGTFALDGPEQCSGITVERYSADALVAQFDEHFERINSEVHTHRTPWGAEQRFVWVTLRRRPDVEDFAKFR